MKPFRARGDFWLPDIPNRRVSGTLVFDGSAIQLQLNDSLVEVLMPEDGALEISPELVTHPRLLWLFTDVELAAEGTLGSGHHVTLVGASAIVFALPAAETRESWDIDAAILGAHTVAGSASKARIEFDALEPWVNPPWIVTRVAQNGVFEADVSESVLSEVTVEETTYRIHTSVEGIWGLDVHLDRVTTIEVEAPAELPLGDVMNVWARPTHDFLIVCLGAPVALERVKVEVVDLYGRERWASLVTGALQNVGTREYSSAVLRQIGTDALLFGDDSAAAFEHFFPEWLALRSRLGKVIDHLTSVWYAPFMYSETRYGNLFKAGEALSKKQYETAELPKEEHQQRVRQIVDAALEASVNRDHVDWAERVLGARNDSPLQKLMTQLIADSGTVGAVIDGAVPDVGRLMASARTAVSHGGMTTDVEIQHLLGVVLSFVLRLHLLRGIGARSDTLEKRILSARAFRRAINRLAALTA